MSTLGRYEIVSELGRGGMGVVYVGRDPKINRPVAIKCLHPNQGSGSDEDRKRFAKEMRALGRLIHQNIVTIFDADEDPVTGAAYIVMEYVEGKSLAEIVSSGERLSATQVREIGIQICMALDFAHEKGIIHRDMKPGNVLISAEDKTVKLVDFGIARLEEEGFTQTSSFLGTPRYMSPEQCTGDIIEKRSDLFSASAVLYELLTLRKAFSGDSPAAIIHQVVNHRPDPPMTISRDVPKDLNDAVMKGLEKKPTDRFISCKEMALVLQKQAPLQGASSSKKQPPQDDSAPTISLKLGSDSDATVDSSLVGVNTPRRFAPQNKKTMILVGGIVLLAVSALVIGLKMLPVSQKAPDIVVPPPVESSPQEKTGNVNFLIDPSGAEVSVDGAVMGLSPLSIVLLAGSHEIKIIKTGYDTLEATIDIPAGGTVPIELKLNKQEER